MEATAEAFLAAAQTDTALRAEKDEISDDDRSSSLSEISEDLDSPEPEPLPVQTSTVGDNDSEAETERLEISPEKLLAQKKLATSPSRLGNLMNIGGNQEAETFSDSVMSSPLPSDDGSLDDPDGEDLKNETSVKATDNPAVLNSAKKRKRSLLAGLADLEDVDSDQPRLKRTRSLKSNEDELSEDGGESNHQAREDSHETTDAEDGGAEGDDSDASNEENKEEHDDVVMNDVVSAESEKKADGLRRASRRTTGEHEIQSPSRDVAAQAEDVEGSEDEEGAEEEDEVDDAEAVARSEEEAAKRLAAMEALTALEKHFATLRDRLYDERISSINQELAQLASSKPTHPELLRQIECVEKYRDEKFAIEQKLLVYRVGALKRKSVAERSQIHSAYFQTVRDLRERHLERVSEHFYRIQRDRFKADNRTEDFTIPFPDKRSVQVTQQTAYNKEVSILSGVAKYVGFPAAPELPSAQGKELDDDLEKMGISAAQTRLSRQTRRAPMTNPFTSSVSQPAAEEQFLEQNPWANPQHPVHRHRLQMSRQASNQLPSNDSLITPAQQRIVDISVPIGSASTIVENPSAHVSSAINTPHEDLAESRIGAATQSTFHIHSSPPFDSHRTDHPTLSNHVGRKSPPPQPAGSSPLASRATISPSRTQAERVPRHETASPSLLNRFGRDSGITAGAGLSRFTLR